MATDDLSAPLGQDKRKARSGASCCRSRSVARRSPRRSALFVCVFARLGGDRRRSARRRADRDRDRPIAPAGTGEPRRRRTLPAAGPARYDGPDPRRLPPKPPSRHADRHHHRRHERQAAGGRRSGDRTRRQARRRSIPALLETSRHGPIPKIAPDGARPAEAYARKRRPQRPAMPTARASRSSSAGSASARASTAEALRKLPGTGHLRVRALRQRSRQSGRARPRRRPRGAAAGADGAVRLSRQRSGSADAADLAVGRAEHRPPALADEPLPGLCRRRQLHGRALHRVRAGARAGAARDRASAG